MSNLDWQEKLWEFEHLRQFAAVRHDETTAMEFLHSAQVVPYDITVVPEPDYIITNLDPKAIKGKYLAALAHMWDKDGPSTPIEFVDSLKPELMGSAEREVVREQLEMVGRENQ